MLLSNDGRRDNCSEIGFREAAHFFAVVGCEIYRLLAGGIDDGQTDVLPHDF